MEQDFVGYKKALPRPRLRSHYRSSLRGTCGMVVMMNIDQGRPIQGSVTVAYRPCHAIGTERMRYLEQLMENIHEKAVVAFGVPRSRL